MIQRRTDRLKLGAIFSRRRDLRPVGPNRSERLVGAVQRALRPAVLLGELRGRALRRAGLTEDELLAKIEQRKVAREAKDFAESDRVRDELSARGIGLMDGSAVPWRPVPVVDAP